MHQKGFSRPILLIIIGAVVIAGVMFWYWQKKENTLQGVTPDTLEIQEGTQGEFGDLRIGLGYTRADDYVDDSGAKQHGDVAGLWIYVRDNSAQNRTLTVYAGKSFTIGKYSIFVDQVAERSVRLLIWEPDLKL